MARVGKQTGLTLEKLLFELCNQPSPYPECLIMNDIGGLCLDGDKEAETVLIQRLTAGLDKPELKVIAFCYLLTTENIDAETFSKLVAFEEKPENKELVALARKIVSEK